MEINLILAIFIAIFCLILLPSFAILLIKNERLIKILGTIYFACFLVVLAMLVFGEVKIQNKVFILNFVTNNKWFSLNFLWGYFSLSNILLNIFMLIPVGAFVVCQNAKNGLLKSVIISFIISFVIEIFQYVLPISRTSELLDIVLNTLSGTLGYIYFYGIKKLSIKIIK